MTNKGILYKSMNKGRIKVLALGIILFLLCGFFAVNYSYYLKTFFKGASPLDAQLFLSETNSISIKNDYKANKNDMDYYLNDFAVKDTSYWQNNKYRFLVEADIKTEKVVIYKEDIAIGNKVKAVDSMYIHIAEIDGESFLILAPASFDIKNAHQVKGVLTKPAKSVLADLAKNLENGEELNINEYMLDTRKLEMGMEYSVLGAVLILLFLALFLIIKAIIYFKNPRLTPTYKQLKKYGEIDDIINDIENQLKGDDVEYEKHKIYTEDWILIDSSFMKKVEKNPAKGHQFKYTPDLK